MGDIFGWKLISEHIMGNHHIQLCIKSHRSPSLSLAICIYPSEQTYNVLYRAASVMVNGVIVSVVLGIMKKLLSI